MTTSTFQLSSQLLVGELLKRATHKTPNREAFVFGEKRITYKELDNRATVIAGWLQKNDIEADDKVGYILKNSLAIVELFYGVALSGGVGVPINFRLTVDELEYIINNSDSQILFIDQEYEEVIQLIADKIPKVKTVVVVGEVSNTPRYIKYESIFENQVEYQPCAINDNDAAMIIYTSGTTGRPKGAVITHKNLCQSGMNLLWEGKGTLFEKQLAVIPLFHIAGISILIRTCLVSGTTVIHRDFNAVAVLQTIESEKISVLALIPAIWNFLFQVPTLLNYDLSSVLRCSTGGAITPLELKKMIIKYFPNAVLMETFGQTETTSSTTCLYGEDALRKPTSVGRSIINVEVRVVDDEMNDVPIGEVGEIVYRGPTVMKEYYNNPEATAEAFFGGWFHSGDFVKMDEEGFIYVIDRKKDMLISGGENIYPAEIEEVLYTHPDILECAVIGVPDETWGESVKAIIVLKPDRKISSEDIINYCKHYLASYKKPKEIEFVKVLPRNTSGKVLKQVLRNNALI